jgi:VIT1/CCC1 family predicted Fe2+/Mn2+ transporter
MVAMDAKQYARQSAWVRDIIIGMSDGITVPFALTAGISGAVTNNSIILTAGLAEICAGSISMALGGYLSAKTELEHYNTEKATEHRQIHEVRESEKQEVRAALAQYGLSQQVQDQVAEELSGDEKNWVAFMMRNELGLEEPAADRAKKSAFNIGLSYVVGGCIPLAGYVIGAGPRQGLLWSSCFTLFCLLLFGYLKARFSGERPFSGAMKTAGIGIIAAGSAFAIAYFFNHSK